MEESTEAARTAGLPWRISLLVVLAVGMAGCAHTYTDASGARHVIGFAHVTLPAVPSSAETLRARTFGLLLTQAETGTAISLGVSESSVTMIRADSCAILSHGPVPIGRISQEGLQ